MGIAGFLGGLLNAVAGGGSFITLPALIFAGLPAVVANATGAAALLPGYIASAWRFKNDIELPVGLSLTTMLLIASGGGSVGAVILLLSGERIFSFLVPWLILLATIAFAVGPRLLCRQAAESELSDVEARPSRRQTLTASVSLFVVCVYGGYFNGGLGIILLAVLGLMGQTNLHGMNGLKSLLSAILTAVAVVVYAAGNAISLKYFLVLGLCAIMGGYIGAVISYQLSRQYLRYFVIFIGLLMTIIFLAQSL